MIFAIRPYFFSKKERISSADGALFILICDLPIFL